MNGKTEVPTVDLQLFDLALEDIEKLISLLKTIKSQAKETNNCLLAHLDS